MNNWKTNLAGVLTLISAGAYLGKKVLTGQPITQEDVAVLIAALSGMGLLAAKDHNK